MLIKTALEKLREQVDPKRQRDIYQCIQEAQSRLEKYLITEAGLPTKPAAKSLQLHSSSATSLPQSSSERSLPESFDGDDYWPPFRMACNPKNPAKLREIALDQMQKLFAHRYFIGSRPISFTPGQEDIPASASASATSMQQQQQPQNNHAESVAGLNGKSIAAPKTEDTGKSSGSQFKSSYAPLLIDDMIHTVCLASPLISFTADGQSTAEASVHLQILKVLLTAVTTESCEVHETSLMKCLQACINIHLYSKNLVNQTTGKASLTQICHFLFTKLETYGREHETEIAASIGHGTLASMEESPVAPGGTALVADNINIDDSPDLVQSTNGEEFSPYSASPLVYYRLLEKDTLLLFRLLCRLSMKIDRPTSTGAIGGSNSGSRSDLPDELSPTTIKCRAMALEMILSLLTNSPTVFTDKELFLGLVRQLLTVAVSKNGLVTQPVLFELAISLFLILLKSFRAQLKSEIEVIFNEIYLFIIDSPTSTFRLKFLVLQALYKICSNPQIIVDIYLNYDCDLSMASIYERIVALLSKTAQGNGVKLSVGSGASAKTVGVFGVAENATADAAVLQERKLRSKALRCLVALLVSLSDWTKESAAGSGLSTVAVPQAMVNIAQQEIKTALSTTIEGAAAHSQISPGQESYGGGKIVDEKTAQLPLSPPSIPVLPSKNPLNSLSLQDSNGHSRVPSNGLGNGLHDEQSLHPPLEQPEQYEKMKNRKALIRQGLAKFNDNPSKGVAMLKDCGFLSDDRSVIEFLRHNPEITKAAIGDFIGDGKEYNIQMLQQFVTDFDFRKIDFVSALRRFLQAFRLPGEAQKIDRIMESFAAKYCDNNPEVFAKADVAYTLAFSIMMLNTDLHSTRIKNRMTKPDFIKNNRGINDNGDLPDSFLSSIFDEIQRNEIVLEEERTQKALEKMTAVGFVDARQQRRELFKREAMHIEKKSQKLIKRGKDKQVTPFKSAAHVNHGRSMFDVLWCPLLAAINMIYEECMADKYAVGAVAEPWKFSGTEIPGDDTNFDLVDLCLAGFYHSIVIACQSRMETERDNLIAALGKFSALGEITSMKPKTVAAIKLMVSLGLTMGAYLEDSWVHVFRTISDLDRWQLVGDANGGITTGTAEISKQQQNSNNGAMNLSDVYLKTMEEIKIAQSRRPSLVALMQELRTQTVLISIDRIFSSSAALDGSSIVHFYQKLCATATTEVDASRTFMLQKIVEISYYNMTRIRLEWTQIWKILTGFFNQVGCHENVAVASYAVDSLRQLGMKFLERAELSHFTSHSEFLKPLEHIMRQCPHTSIRELVIQSATQMIVARAKNLRSGWKTMFVILSRAASEKESLQLIRNAFEVTSKIMTSYQDLITEYFVDYATCVGEFAFIDPSIKDSERILESSIRLLVECTNFLAKDLGAADSCTIIDDETYYLKWFPVLSALSRVARDSAVPHIRQKALNCLFDSLKTNGRHLSFEGGHWKSVVKSIMLPLFEDLRSTAPQSGFSSQDSLAENVDSTPLAPDATSDSANNNSTVWIQTTRGMLDVYSQYLEPSGDNGKESFQTQIELIDLLLDIVVLLLGRNSENLAQSGVIYLTQFIQRNALRFTRQTWRSITRAVEAAFKQTIPVELLRFPSASATEAKRSMEPLPLDSDELKRVISSINVKHAILKCAVHLMVLQNIRELLFENGDEALQAIGGNSSTQAQRPVGSYKIHFRPSQTFMVVPRDLQARWLAAFHASFVFAQTFNSNYDLRFSLWRAGVVQQMPNLVKQETLAIGTHISLLSHLYRTYGDRSNTEHKEIPTEDDSIADSVALVDLLSDSGLKYNQQSVDDTLQALLTECRDVLQRFIAFLRDPQKFSRDISSWAPIVRLIYLEILAMPWGNSSGAVSVDLSVYDQFKTSIPGLFYSSAINILCGTDRPEIRFCLQQFMNRIGLVIDNDNFIKML